MFVCGDFNSSCGDKEGFISGVDTLSNRDVIDHTENRYGSILCHFLIFSNICILNGIKRIVNDYTSVSSRGCAVVDYCFVTYDRFRHDIRTLDPSCTGCRRTANIPGHA